MSLPFDREHIDEARLETDAAYRFGYLAAYVGLDETDRALIRASRVYLQPKMPELLAALQDRLLGWSNTRRHFAGQPPKMVTVHLAAYVDALLRIRDDEDLGLYLERVARAHGPTRGDATIVVPMVQLDGLLGFIADQVIGAVGAMDLPEARRLGAIRAWSKLLWIQADLFHWEAGRRGA